MQKILMLTAALLVFFSAGMIAPAQMAVAPPAPEVQLRSGAELDQMLGPIALYPDPLIAQILPAATLPSEIVLAGRSLNGGFDPNAIDQQPWDPCIKALARYPAVLKWMDDNLAWTTTLGQAFLSQQQDVMDSIQRLRAQAQALGNLQSTPQETVMVDNGIIELLPANPQMIYVPVYQPDLVYFRRPFGAPFISFGLGFTVGLWLNHDFDWRQHHLIVWHHDQPRPADWWFHRPSERPRIEVSHAALWQPHSRPSSAVQVMDRGWDTHPVHSPAVRPEAMMVQRPVAVSRARPANDALLGVHSSRETQQFSNRGQESRQTTISRPATPPAHAAPPARSEAPSHPVGGGRR